MDYTSIQLGSETRNDLREFKKANDYQNYDVAVQSLLETVEEAGAVSEE